MAPIVTEFNVMDVEWLLAVASTVAVVCSLVLITFLCCCAEKREDVPDDPPPKQSEQTPTPTPTSAPAPEPTPEPVEESVKTNMVVPEALPSINLQLHTTPELALTSKVEGRSYASGGKDAGVNIASQPSLVLFGQSTVEPTGKPVGGKAPSTGVGGKSMVKVGGTRVQQSFVTSSPGPSVSVSPSVTATAQPSSPVTKAGKSCSVTVSPSIKKTDTSDVGKSSTVKSMDPDQEKALGHGASLGEPVLTVTALPIDNKTEQSKTRGAATARSPSVKPSMKANASAKPSIKAETKKPELPPSTIPFAKTATAPVATPPVRLQSSIKPFTKIATPPPPVRLQSTKSEATDKLATQATPWADPTKKVVCSIKPSAKAALKSINLQSAESGALTRAEPWPEHPTMIKGTVPGKQSTTKATDPFSKTNKPAGQESNKTMFL